MVPIKEKTWMPLGFGLSIENSGIHGKGLFTTEDIESGTILGMSHIIVDEELIRTALGGFYNHSEVPNCKKITNVMGDRWWLVADAQIHRGDEITVKYTFYDV